MASQSNRSRWVMLGGVALALTALAGCYERVVGAQGLGATGVMIHEPSVKDQSSDGSLNVQELRVTPTRKSSKPW